MSSQRGRPQKWEEKLCLEAIRRYEADCLVKGERPSIDGYECWHKQTRNTPSSATLCRVGNTWNALRLRAAENPDEIELNPPVFPRRPQWTEAKCLAALSRYQAEQKQAGGKVTFEGYEAWQRGRKDAPSPYTMKNLGIGRSWKEIVSQASRFTEERER